MNGKVYVIDKGFRAVCKNAIRFDGLFLHYVLGYEVIIL